MAVRPTHDQVLLLAPDIGAAKAALPVANPASWSATGCDEAAVWGSYIAASAEPYNVAVDLSDHRGAAYRCNCPSRKIPCKHCLGLLLLHAAEQVAPARRLPFADDWLRRRAATRQATADSDDDTDDPTAPPAPDPDPGSASHDGGAGDVAADASLGGGSRAPRPEFGLADPARQKRQLERAATMRAGLRELDRWLADRIRVGLAAAELGDLDTWERIAARLVDAQCGALANRVKRIATKVGQSPRWHEEILEELAVLHALAVSAQRTSSLPADLADGVHAATGLTVAKNDVLAGVPTTAHWIVAGESRVREDRITVQRTWLATAGPGPITWAMVLAFGAFGSEVVTEYPVGTAFAADVHWYPGGLMLRALVGRLHTEPGQTSAGPRAGTIAAALAECGWAIAREPWLERYPVCVTATPTPTGNGRWSFSDETGSLAVAAGCRHIAELVAVSGGQPIDIVGEWSVDGLLPLTIFATSPGGAVIAL